MNNREDGDDLHQDSLVSALTKFANLREAKSFRTWLYRIIINGYTGRPRRGEKVGGIIGHSADNTISPSSREPPRQRLSRPGRHPGTIP